MPGMIRRHAPSSFVFDHRPPRRAMRGRLDPEHAPWSRKRGCKCRAALWRPFPLSLTLARFAGPGREVRGLVSADAARKIDGNKRQGRRLLVIRSEDAGSRSPAYSVDTRGEVSECVAKGSVLRSVEQLPQHVIHGLTVLAGLRRIV